MKPKYMFVRSFICRKDSELRSADLRKNVVKKQRLFFLVISPNVIVKIDGGSYRKTMFSSLVKPLITALIDRRCNI